MARKPIPEIPTVKNSPEFKIERVKKQPALDQTLAEERVEEIAAMILDFKPRKEIVDFVCKKYNVKPKTVDFLLIDAHAYIRNHRTTNFETIVELHIKTYLDIIRDNRTTDPRTSLMAMAQLEKLLKLNSDAPIIQQNILNLNLDKLDNEQLLNYINKIKEQ